MEDGDATFRFKYSTEFLQWYVLLWFQTSNLNFNVPLRIRALQVPGYRKEWHVGVRVKSNKKLVGFISGVPMLLRVRKK